MKERAGRRAKVKIAGVLIGLLLFVGCPQSSPSGTASGSALPNNAASVAKTTAAKETAAPAPEKKLTHAELVDKGRQVYQSNCTACHNMNPAQKGSLGPAVSGSSEALLEARVVHGNYPPGYTPKADTRLMVAMPYLKKDIKALAAYLEN